MSEAQTALELLEEIASRGIFQEPAPEIRGNLGLQTVRLKKCRTCPEIVAVPSDYRARDNIYYCNSCSGGKNANT